MSLRNCPLFFVMDTGFRIHLDGDFGDVPPVVDSTSSLFTITYYFPKILVFKRKVKSEEVRVKK